MFKTNYKATIKALLRSPVTLLAFGATVILTLALYEGGRVGEWGSVRVARQEIWNGVHGTCNILFPSFLGIMIAAHILSEKQNGFGDVLVSSRKSILSIYLSKLCAIGTITLVARAIFLAATVYWDFGLRYPEELALGNDVFLPLGKIIAFYAANEAVYMPFLLLCYIAMPVFVATATNIPATGAVWNVGYYLTGVVFRAFGDSNFYLPTETIQGYMKIFHYIDDPEYMEGLKAGYNTISYQNYPPAFSEALTVYIAWILFSIALLTVSYFLLKRRYRT